MRVPRPRLLLEAVAVLPDAWRARRALAKERDIRALLASLDRAPARGTGRPASAPAVYRGVWATMYVLPYRDAGRCLYAALTLYVALRRRGLAPTFVSGVRRGPQGIAGHAWVELDGRRLDPVEGAGRGEYVESLRHPRTEPVADSAPERQTAQR